MQRDKVYFNEESAKYKGKNGKIYLKEKYLCFLGEKDTINFELSKMQGVCAKENYNYRGVGGLGRPIPNCVLFRYNGQKQWIFCPSGNSRLLANAINQLNGNINASKTAETANVEKRQACHANNINVKKSNYISMGSRTSENVAVTNRSNHLYNQQNKKLLPDNLTLIRDSVKTVAININPNDQKIVEKQKRKEKYSMQDVDKISQMKGTKAKGDCFEHYCANLLQYNGFRNIEVIGGAGDLGADIIAWMGSRKYAFQCKCYQGTVPYHSLEQIVTARKTYAAGEGVILTNSYFTVQTKTYAAEHQIYLWDRDKLQELIDNTNEVVAYKEL